MKDPNFIIGGTAAGGTSFLSALLVQHPQIYLPKQMRPEPHFFYKSWEYKKGLDYYLSRWFADVPTCAIATGERSSSYLFGGEQVARKISSQYPDMKFLFTLRNPIERTWANYRYTVLQGLEDLSFEDALEKEEKRIQEQSDIWAEIQPYNYTGRGFYGLQIREYMTHFPIENMLFVKSELLASQTDQELHKICEFLKLTLKRFNYDRVPNHTSVNVRDPRLQMELRNYFGERFDLIIEAIRKELPIDRFISTENDNGKIDLLRSNLTSEKTSMPSECRNYLKQLFSSDMKDLQALVDFSLEDWK